ncbi:MAG: extracellular solute-binding protein [Clostridia bacterium]|nr:extracellular solute-binding protein [Clostridia bacterium]
MKLRLCLLLLLILPLAFGALGETSYDAFLASNALPDAGGEILITPSDYTDISMEDAYAMEDGALFTRSSGWVEYTVPDVPQSALYAVKVRYYPAPGTGADIQRALYVNGELPYEEMGALSLSRLWNNRDDSYKTVKGNQPFPSQVETPQWREVYLKDSGGYAQGPLLIALNQGENTLRFVSRREDMILGSISLVPRPQTDTYDRYLEKLLAEGKTYYSGEGIKLQAEDAALKSGPSFYPLNDRTSPLSEPYHYSNIVLNMIGGSAWNEPGEWMAWDVEAPQDGLYKLGLRFKQNELKGLYATRALTVNGEIPFTEASDLRFYDRNSWQFEALGEYDSEGGLVREYWIYLQKGVNRIELEVSLGALGSIITDLNDVTADLNALYREIVAITGSSPDSYRDYQLFTRIPDLSKRLYDFQDRVNGILDRLTLLTGSNSERTAGMTRLVNLISRIAQDENKVVKQLGAFKECITSMGKSVLDLTDQPLKIDYFILYGTKEPKVRADANVFESAWHSVRAFVGSFTNDYNVSVADTGANTKSIEVWLSTGRDQFDVIRRLINESFEAQNDVKVSLKLIGADVVLPATATGNGPDVAIQIANSAPVNFAFRDAAYDLTQFEDYPDVAARFSDAAVLAAQYQGGVYGLPDQMSYPVLFVRTDILNQLGLSVPETWDDLVDMIPVLEKNNMEIYLDTNPVSTLGAALSMGNSRAINTVFLSLLYQAGGEIYRDDGMTTMFDTAEANACFKSWTRFYTQHNFPQDIDFTTRFRIGEVPVGIVDLGYYNTLAVSAPEIRGLWTVARVPGTRQEDGGIKHDVPCVTSEAMIIKNMAEKNGTVNEAWLFLKWWTSAETQTAYAREMEAVLGTSGRYLVANLESYSNAVWPDSMLPTIKAVLGDLHGIPQVPGGYITGRYLYNAFITVITEYENAADTLFECNELINKEITKKRREFGLPVDE